MFFGSESVVLMQVTRLMEFETNPVVVVYSCSIVVLPEGSQGHLTTNDA